MAFSTFKSRISKRFRRGFTLIEILTVVAIIGMVAVIIVGLKPGNPRGMDDACRIAGMEFRVAQAQAVRGANPDRDPQTNKRYNIRSAVLILNDEDDTDNHMRQMRTIVGGTDDQEKTDIRDYYWYAVGEPVLLPENVYFVAPDSTDLDIRSIVEPVEGGNDIKIDPTTEGQKAGTGKKRWYAYYYDCNGQTYMTRASFMIAQGAHVPGSGVRFDKNAPVQGFAITRSGAIVYTRDSEEAEIASE